MRKHAPDRFARVVFVLAIALAAVLAHTANADEITLKGSVRLAPAADVVRLMDIADIDGVTAGRYAQTEIAHITDHTNALVLSIGDVRAKLTDAGMHWGKVQLNGNRVIVRPAQRPTSGPPMAMTAVSIDEVTTPTRQRSSRAIPIDAQTLVEQPTLRGELARMIASGLGIAPRRLKLTFDESDAVLLASNLETNRFELQPLSSLRSDRIEVSVRAWSPDTIGLREVITVSPSIKTEVVVLKRAVRRGERFLESDFTFHTRWLPPSQAGAMSSLVEAVGRVAGGPLKAGAPLRKKHVKREVVIKRGDRVMVRCMVGGLVITLEAEARSDGAEGEVIELRKLGERDTFMGRAVGPGAATIDLSRT